MCATSSSASPPFREAPRSLRLASGRDAAASGRAPEVGRSPSRAGLPHPRGRHARRRRVPALLGAAAARRACVLRSVACANCARAAAVPSAGCRRTGGARDGGRPRRASARGRGDCGDRRRVRRLSRPVTSVLVTPSRSAQRRRRPHRTNRSPPRRRYPHRDGIHDGPRARPRSRARGRVPRLHGLRVVPPVAAGAASGTTAGALRRGARALQERRRAWRGVAWRRHLGSRGEAAHRRHRLTSARRRGARRRGAGGGVDAAAVPGGRGRRPGRIDLSGPAVPIGGNGPRRRRGVLPRTCGDRDAGRRHSRPRGGRRERTARGAG